VYGKRSALLDRHFLHAHHLGFHHPATGEVMDFKSALPRELTQVIDGLKPLPAEIARSWPTSHAATLSD
jgi:hypothetical protein